MVMQGIIKNSNIETQIEIVTAEDATKMPIIEGAVNHLSYDYIPLMGNIMKYYGFVNTYDHIACIVEHLHKPMSVCKI